MTAMVEHVHTVVVGAGFGGLGMAIRLEQAGMRDYVVLERTDELGGTWRDNTYPGCGCDVPSHLYSFSFAPNPEWSRTFSGQEEIWDYMRRCADDFGITSRIRFGHEMLSARWDESSDRWQIETSRGPLTAQVLIAAPGALSTPATPALEGLERFRGTAFHSAEWDHEHDLTGRTVAVVGTGASAVQFIPEIAPRVARLLVFQRTAPWIMPRRDRALTEVERRVYRALPAAQQAMRAGIYWARETFVFGFLHPRFMGLQQRIAERHLRTSVPDPGLRARLTPSYTMGCKRILISNDYLPTLAGPGVELVTERIREVRPEAIVTEDGAVHEVDTVIFGTGFHVVDMPIGGLVRGRDGRLLEDVWRGSPQAYLGTTVAGFPNLFLLAGPNTGLGHTSVIVMIEAQVDYVMDCLRSMERNRLAAVEVREEVQAAFNAEVQARMQDTVWIRGGCDSWYLDASGTNRTLWPGTTWRFRQRTQRFRPTDYSLRRVGRLEPHQPATAAAAAAGRGGPARSG